jgi:acetyl coenzyme A synthetase (ADP forming)-like protein
MNPSSLATARAAALRDGSTVRVRPVLPDDESRIHAFLHGLSEESRRLRYFAAVSDDRLRDEARRQANIDPAKAAGVVAIAGGDDHVVGHAEYDVIDGDRAEVSFAVADRMQGQGLGTILLGQLAQIASSRGLRAFEAIVQPGNYRMLEVFRTSGFPVRTHVAPGEIRVEFPTALNDEALAQFEHREWISAVNAVRAFFVPRSVAVIGASRQRGTIGGEVLHNLLAYGFNGPVLPVNPNASVVQSVVTYASVEDVPGPVDLAVIVVPASAVLSVAEACGRKGVRALVVISSGFAETGGDGRTRQEQLVQRCRAAGMRLIGPNCMGLLNTDPGVRLNATFAPTPPPTGRVAFMSQSGALGVAVIDHASTLGLGLSTFVSVGNKADLSGSDFVRYWEQDPATDVILLYLESFGNPRKFSRIARRVTRVKPIVAVKSGRSGSGARATGSHTGSLLSTSDVSVDALFQHAGVIRTDTLEQMFDVASLLASQPPPAGRRVAILTNAGGPGILCADACEAEGLVVPPLADETAAALRALLPREASVSNPVDMIASASADHYRRSIEILGRDASIDALVVIFIQPLVTRPEDVARAIVEGARAIGGAKTVLTVFMQSRGVPDELRSGDVHLPSYRFPEDAALALARAARYAEWRAQPLAPPPAFPDLRRDEGAAIVARALGAGPGWLSAADVVALLGCYGLPALEQHLVPTPEEAAAAAARLAGPVALKAIAPGLVHKTDAGAVRLHLAPESVAQEARDMTSRVARNGHSVTGFLVQRMAAPGVEMIVGVAHDPHFGPVVACGAGGVLVELLKDVAVRLAPLSEHDAEEMVRQLRTYPLLTGYRGAPAADVRALVETILRVSAMVEDLPQIRELDLNPVLVHEHGVSIVDARVAVMPVEPVLMPGLRE